MRLLLLILLFVSIEAQAVKFKVRAREHFETHKIDLSGTRTTYKGLSNTINFWWEMPYELYYGFYFTPVISSLKEDEPSSPLGEDIKLFSIGLAGKYFVHKLIPQTYGRIEYGFMQMQADGTKDNSNGHSILLGFGYEFPLEMFGLALEAAFRYSDLTNDTTIRSFTPSIGFHFYEKF